jgi:hypothetical protein
MESYLVLILSILVIAACFGVGYLFVLQGQQQNVGDLPLGSGFNPSISTGPARN